MQQRIVGYVNQCQVLEKTNNNYILITIARVNLQQIGTQTLEMMNYTYKIYLKVENTKHRKHSSWGQRWKLCMCSVACASSHQDSDISKDYVLCGSIHMTLLER